MRSLFLFVLYVIPFLGTCFGAEADPGIQIGMYYFGGWQSGSNWHLDKPNSLLMTSTFRDRMPLTGWYDDNQQVMDQEIQWAVRGGVEYFAFLWYWPGGQQLEKLNMLNSPFENFLKSDVPERKRLKFCIVYTNHNPYDIPPGVDWRRFTKLWIDLMRREDYFRVAMKRGDLPKPLFIVWSPQTFHDHWKTAPEGARGALISLREVAAKEGLPGIIIGGCWDQTVSKEIFEKDGFDFVTAYNLHLAGHPQVNEPGTYDSLAKGHISIWDSMAAHGKPIIPVITSGWDPRPWPGEAMGSPYYPDRTPQKFDNFCRSAKDWIDTHQRNVVVPKTLLIYSWNELGEGGYVLPTVGEGYSYLEAIKKVFGEKQSPKE